MPRTSINITNFNTPQQVTTSQTLVRNLTFFGYSGFNNSGIAINNAGTVFIGNFSSGEFPMSVGAGSSFQYTITTASERENLANWWIRGATLDGVYIIYN